MAGNWYAFAKAFPQTTRLHKKARPKLKEMSQ